MRINLSKKILSYLPLIWLTGLLLPALYLLYLKNIKKPLLVLAKSDVYIWCMVLFLFVQILSVLFSVYQEYFTFDRLVAIMHNLVAFSFLILGYSIGYFQNAREFLVRSLKGVLLFISLLCIAAFSYSILTARYIDYSGIIQWLTGVESDFTKIVINQQGWIAGREFPRSVVMTTFPNSTALLLLAIFLSFFYYNPLSFHQKLFFGLLFVVATITTGSRNGTLIAMFLFVLQFVSNKRTFFLLVFIFPLVIVLGLWLVGMLSELRKDSNETRFLLYWESIKYSMAHNPILGLGLKPKIAEIANGDLPIGSHSTLLGYFIKNGLLGGAMALFFYLYLIATAFLQVCIPIFTRRPYYVRSLITAIGMVFFLLSLLFDDLDAFELIPFYFGFFLYTFKLNNERSASRQAPLSA